jgi:4-hydroxybenzoate polyprenyltransferase
MARPPVFVLFASYAAVGLARGGSADASVPLVEICAAIAGFLIFSVACNDLADEAIDRVNLPGDRRRPLLGGARRSQLSTTGIAGAVAALAASLAVDVRAALVVAIGLVLSAAYSVRPVRVADRGLLAALLLPACYVAVPYMLGLDAAHARITGHDLILLGGLYLGFVGRILLKDFRDVRGDTLFGKRTFLVRHGRRATCTLSMLCWGAGTVVIMIGLADRAPLPQFNDLLLGSLASFAVICIGALAGSTEHRRDERLISTVSILGRGMILLILAALSLADRGYGVFVSLPLLDLLAVLVLAQALRMLRHGPVPRRVDLSPLTSREGGIPALAELSGSTAPGR